MKTDRELLELAAKAAGIVESLEWFEKENCFVLDDVVWNPITDDGDALRLAVMLGLQITVGKVSIQVSKLGFVDISEQPSADPYAATRRAIVRAAAEIGGAA